MNCAVNNSLALDECASLSGLSPYCAKLPAAPAPPGSPCLGECLGMPWLVWNTVVFGQPLCVSSCLSRYLTLEGCAPSESWGAFMSLPSTQL